MSLSDRIRYWKASARRDRKTVETLYKNGDYHWCLFFWHLVLEKLIKAVLLVRHKELIYTHNVLNLARQAELSISTKQEKELKEITSFNLEARYDNEKFSFYKKATKQYTDQWIGICKLYADDWEGLI